MRKLMLHRLQWGNQLNPHYRRLQLVGDVCCGLLAMNYFPQKDLPPSTSMSHENDSLEIINSRVMHILSHNVITVRKQMQLSRKDEDLSAVTKLIENFYTKLNYGTTLLPSQKINKSGIHRELVKQAVVKGSWINPSYKTPADYQQQLESSYQILNKFIDVLTSYGLMGWRSETQSMKESMIYLVNARRTSKQVIDFIKQILLYDLNEMSNLHSEPPIIEELIDISSENRYGKSKQLKMINEYIDQQQMKYEVIDPEEIVKQLQRDKRLHRIGWKFTQNSYADHHLELNTVRGHVEQYLRLQSKYRQPQDQRWFKLMVDNLMLDQDFIDLLEKKYREGGVNRSMIIKGVSNIDLQRVVLYKTLLQGGFQSIAFASRQSPDQADGSFVMPISRNQFQIVSYQTPTITSNILLDSDIVTTQDDWVTSFLTSKGYDIITYDDLETRKQSIVNTDSALVKQLVSSQGSRSNKMRDIFTKGQVSKSYNTRFGNTYMGRNMFKIHLSNSPWTELSKQKSHQGDNIAREINYFNMQVKHHILARQMAQNDSLLNVIQLQGNMMQSKLSQGVNVKQPVLKYGLPLMLGAVMSMNVRKLNTTVENRTRLMEQKEIQLNLQRKQAKSEQFESQILQDEESKSFDQEFQLLHEYEQNTGRFSTLRNMLSLGLIAGVSSLAMYEEKGSAIVNPEYLLLQAQNDMLVSDQHLFQFDQDEEYIIKKDLGGLEVAINSNKIEEQQQQFNLIQAMNRDSFEDNMLPFTQNIYPTLTEEAPIQFYPQLQESAERIQLIKEDQMNGQHFINNEIPPALFQEDLSEYQQLILDDVDEDSILMNHRQHLERQERQAALEQQEFALLTNRAVPDDADSIFKMPKDVPFEEQYEWYKRMRQDLNEQHEKKQTKELFNRADPLLDPFMGMDAEQEEVFLNNRGSADNPDSIFKMPKDQPFEAQYEWYKRMRQDLNEQHEKEQTKELFNREEPLLGSLMGMDAEQEEVFLNNRGRVDNPVNEPKPEEQNEYKHEDDEVLDDYSFDINEEGITEADASQPSFYSDSEYLRRQEFISKVNEQWIEREELDRQQAEWLAERTRQNEIDDPEGLSKKMENQWVDREELARQQAEWLAQQNAVPDYGEKDDDMMPANYAPPPIPINVPYFGQYANPFMQYMNNLINPAEVAPEQNPVPEQEPEAEQAKEDKKGSAENLQYIQKAVIAAAGLMLNNGQPVINPGAIKARIKDDKVMLKQGSREISSELLLPQLKNKIKERRLRTIMIAAVVTMVQRVSRQKKRLNRANFARKYLLGKQKRAVTMRKSPVIDYKESETKKESKKLKKRVVKANQKSKLVRADRTSGII